MSTVEFEVEKNKDYTLSYRFLTSGAKYASNGFDTYLVRTGIVVPDGSLTWGTDGYVVYMATNAAYTAVDGIFANRTSIADRTNNFSAEGAWNQVTMKFNSGNNTTLKLLVQAGTDTFYVDDFSLNEVFDYESLSNWGIYNASSSDANYTVVTNYDGESHQTKNSWMSITNNTAQDADSTGKSIKIYGNGVNIAANLPVLKANTKYTLSFKYKPGATSAIASNGAYFTSHVIKKGTAFNGSKNGPVEFIANLGKGTETSDWKELSVDFTTDTTTDYMLEFRFAFAAGYECFIDAITLTEKENTPDPEGTITFETATVGDHLTYIEATPEKDKAPNYPEGGKWQVVSNNGYITYTDVTNVRSKVANTYAETIYKADGTAVTQTPIRDAR